MKHTLQKSKISQLESHKFFALRSSILVIDLYSVWDKVFILDQNIIDKPLWFGQETWIEWSGGGDPTLY